MFFKLPVLKEVFKGEDILSEEGVIDCELNLTLDAQQTWEDTFPEMAKKISLFDYVDKMKDVKIQDQATAMISLKILFCFLIFEDKMNYRDFVRLFTFANEEYFIKLTKTITDILSVINKRNSDKKKH